MAYPFQNKDIPFNLSTYVHIELLFSVEMEGLVDPENKLDHGVPHQCIPLYSLLIALGSPTINYFRLIEIDS